MPKRKPSPPKEIQTPVSAPAQWHKALAAITGELSLAIIHRKMLRGDVIRWRNAIDDVMGEMDALIDGPR